MQFRIPAARCARGVHLFSPNKGRGECRAPNAPTASRVKVETTHELATTGPPESPGIPTQWFTAYSVISPAIRFLTPSLADLRQLDAAAEASEPHALAVRVRRSRQAHHPRPPHPAPRP